MRARLSVEEAMQAGLLDDPKSLMRIPAKPKKRRPNPKSKGEETFALQCEANKHVLPPTHREYEFAKSIGRKWRLDFAWPDAKLGLECEGLITKRIGNQVVTMGRHAHPDGFREDCRKYATAAVLGWTILRFDREMIEKGEAIAFAVRVLRARGLTP